MNFLWLSETLNHLQIIEVKSSRVFFITVTIENVNSVSVSTSVFRTHSQPITRISCASHYNVHQIKWK
jgi:hypothetical protein